MKKQDAVVDKDKIRKGLKFTVIVSLVISIMIIFYTFDQQAFQEIILNLKPVYLLYILLILFLHWLAAGSLLKVLVNAVGEKITLKETVIIFLSGAFVSNVTPFATGGGPFQILFLHSKGVNIGKSSVVVMIQLLLRLFFFGVMTPFFLIFFPHIVSPGVIPDYIFYLAFGVGLLISGGVIILTLIPAIAEKIVTVIFAIKPLKKFIKESGKAKRLIVKAKIELNHFRYSLLILSRKKKALAVSAFLTVIHWSLLFLIIPFILKGLGTEVNIFQAYVMQMIFYLVLPFMPTPGASGIAEVGFASLFVGFIPGNIIGLVMFGWRFFTFYVVLIVGGFFTFREITRFGSYQNE